MTAADGKPPDEGHGAALIRFAGVTYRYPAGEGSALAGIEIAIGRGEIVGIVGPTGAGKTTFCLALNGIVPQFFGGEFFGSVRIAGLDAIETPTSRLAHHVGMVFEDPETQITATTVAEEVAFALENLKVPPPEIATRVEAALQAVGLSGLEDKHPASLSGGQKQRLSIAAALALAPDIIVLDEPTSQLDPVGTAEVFAILERLNREDGLTVVVASHASEELAEIADRILLLDGGRIVLDGAPEAVFSRTAELATLKVRPPEIARTCKVLSKHANIKNPPVTLPITLDEAIGRFQQVSLTGAGAKSTVPAAPAASDRETVLAATGLTHVYPDGTQALHGVDLEIRKGEFLAIAGRNGSGKSTLVRHFLKLLSPGSGTVRVHGEDIAPLKVSDLARRIGYVAQNAHQQIFCDSVAGEIGFALSMMRRPKEEIAARVDAALASMELAWAADRHPISLSRGDRLRVVIAAVLALDPQVLIFDEPTTGQDWRGSMAILDVLAALNRTGKTVVLITHHLYLLPGFVERLVVMDAGRIVADGPLRDVFYDRDRMLQAGLRPPQTVRFAGAVPALAGLQPLGPDDLAARLGLSMEAA